jgi:hypothetical protein
MIALALATGLLPCLFAQPAQQPLTWIRNNPGDTTAIQMNADEAVTWSDGGKRVFLLTGKVWIEQGGDNVRVPQAVVWVDEAAKKTTGVYHVDLYGDGGVALEADSKTHTAAVGLFELNTRGEIKVKTFKNKVVQKAAPDSSDPLYQRALAALKAKSTPPLQSNPIKQVSFEQAQPAPAQVPQPPTVPVPGQAPQVLQPPTVPVPAGPPGTGASPVPVVPPPAPGKQPPLPPRPPETKTVAGPEAKISIAPRTSAGFKSQDYTMPNGEKATVIGAGIIIRIEDPQPPPKGLIILEVQADRAVLWSRGGVHDLVEGSPTSTTEQPNRRFEFYLSGNVEIRTALTKDGKVEDKVLRCKECYYDVSRHVAIALDADLEVKEPLLLDKLHVITPELHQLNEKLFTMPSSIADASKLPYGPGLELDTGEAQLEEKRVMKKSIFGVAFNDPKTGQQEYEDQRIFTGYNVVTRIEGVPVFYFPYLQGDVNDPLGPLQSLSIGYSKAFGFQFFSTWNIFDLLAMDPPPGEQWRLNVDWLSDRGPELGTDFNAAGKDLFGIAGKYTATVTAMGIDDHGTDLLGGNRGVATLVSNPANPDAPFSIPVTHPEERGRFLGNLNWQDMANGFSVQAQLGLVSDRNFLDQYYNNDWVNGLDESSYLYVKQQQNNWAWNALLEQRIGRDWLTETDSLPNVRGYWLGQDFLNMFSNNLTAGAGYFRLQPTNQPPPPLGVGDLPQVTDLPDQTGRFDVWDELSLPFQVGDFKIVPYGLAEAAYYTKGTTGNDVSRFIYGGGIQASIPFSKLYPDLQSELFNYNGIYHKMVFSADYYWAHSNVTFTQLPELDQLNDNETDQALRDIRPWQPLLNPANATMLNSGFFDPQFFALRKLVTSAVDTLDSEDEVTLDWRQRWQTKRGFPGQEHIVDWMTLDLSVSLFPQPDRDDFGKVVNFLQYDWSWAIGDRTTLFSSGWFDPHPGAARAWDIGADLNRPDKSSLYIGYYQIDPLDSKAVIASITVPFSSKYSVTASTSYDFGVNTQINSLMVTRTGSDLLISLGVTYNSIISSFGFAFEIYPNLTPTSHPVPGAAALQR